MAILFLYFKSMWDLNMEILSTIWNMIRYSLNIIHVIFFLLTAWWLYMINKKLWEEYPWLSWIPIVNIYSIVKSSGKSLWWILWITISFMWFIILWIIWVILIFSKYSHWVVVEQLTWPIFIFLFILWIILWLILLHSISKRTWRWGWTTVWLVFVPFIMFPIVGYKMVDKLWEVIKNETIKKVEEKIEL